MDFPYIEAKSLATSRRYSRVGSKSSAAAVKRPNELWCSCKAFSSSKYNAGPLVPAGQPLLPGDLVFYGTPGNVHHVGQYIGAGKMVHAPTFGQPVQVSNYRWSGDDYLAESRPVVDSRLVVSAQE
jgi:cell wall-associated NlpC family hydrolase